MSKFLDQVGRHAEGQRMVAAYPIAKVTDYGQEHEAKSAKKNSTGKPVKTAERKKKVPMQAILHRPFLMNTLST